MKNSPLCAHVHHKTVNLVISRCCFAVDGKEMYKNIVAFLLPSLPSLFKFPMVSQPEMKFHILIRFKPEEENVIGEFSR